MLVIWGVFCKLFNQQIIHFWILKLLSWLLFLCLLGCFGYGQHKLPLRPKEKISGSTWNQCRGRARFSEERGSKSKGEPLQGAQLGIPKASHFSSLCWFIKIFKALGRGASTSPLGRKGWVSWGMGPPRLGIPPAQWEWGTCSMGNLFP